MACGTPESTSRSTDLLGKHMDFKVTTLRIPSHQPDLYTRIMRLTTLIGFLEIMMCKKMRGRVKEMTCELLKSRVGGKLRMVMSLFPLHNTVSR